MKYFFTFILSLFLAFSAKADSDYDRLFPLYVQACALSQVTRTGHPAGTMWGHEILYVKGMCRDELAGYPTVKRCDSKLDLLDPMSGTLVSALRGLNNTNWIAVPGHLAFSGGLTSSDGITSQTSKSLRDSALQQGIFDGIHLRKDLEKQRSPFLTVEEFTSEHSIGTDYAVNWGRFALCHQIPISNDQLDDIIHYLNRLNEPYKNGSAKYKWHSFNNNCAHLVRNTLAAVGIRRPKPTGRSIIHWPADVLTPLDEFLSISTELQELEIPDAKELYLDQNLRKNFMKYGHLPISHGAIIQTYNMMLEQNTLFDISKKISFAFPYSPMKKARLSRALASKNITNLKSNLAFYEKKYLYAIDKIQLSTSIRDVDFDMENKDFISFKEKYLQWLLESLNDVREKISTLHSN
jgi:hypothetical protein